MGELTRRGAIGGAIGGAVGGAVAAATSPANAQTSEKAQPKLQEPPKPAFSFLLVNDIYRMNAENGRGGYGRLAAIVKTERARGTPMLFCHAGDAFSPSLYSGFDHGAHVVTLTNMVAPDAFVPGNHEFDFGPKVYTQRVSEATFPFFAANIRDAAGQPLPRHQDRKIFDLGGFRVGLVGITLADIPMQSNSGDLRFAPVMQTLAAQVALLRKEGAEFIVALTHTDRETDFQIIRSGLVDLLLTGHIHDLFVYWDERTAAVESSHDGNYVTAVDIYASRLPAGDGGAKLQWSPNIRIHDTLLVTPDPAMQARIDDFENDLSRALDVSLATISAELDTRAAAVRYREATGGNLIADAIRAMSGADIAIVNGGSIRGNRVYPAGATLTRRDVLTELPFGNKTVMVKAKGKTVLAALENGFSRLDARAGRFPQISGFQVVADLSQPIGSRVTQTTIAGKPLDPDAAYTVAINDYMLRGGDGYGAFAATTDRDSSQDAGNRLLANDVMAWLRDKGAVTPRLDGRIRIEQQAADNAAR